VVRLGDAEDRRFVAEGDSAAVRELRHAVETGGARLIEINRAGWPACAAAVSLTSWLLTPLLDAAMAGFRHGGLTPRRAAPLVGHQVERTLRSYLKGGRRAWRGPVSPEDQKLFHDTLAALDREDPELAGFVRRLARLAVERMNGDSAWVEGHTARRAATSGVL
jgi:hypothetical protein